MKKHPIGFNADVTADREHYIENRVGFETTSKRNFFEIVMNRKAPFIISLGVK